MKILGIDYGERWIGIAISDDDWKMAFPHEILENNSNFFFNLAEIIKRERVNKIIIGLPLNKKMKSTEQTRKVENWVGKLVKKIKIPVGFENEIFTSKAATKLGVKNQHAAAAALILQSFLDKRQSK